MSEMFTEGSNVDRFLNAFAVIEERMKGILHATRYISFAQSVKFCSGRSQVIRENADILNDYRQLRNSVVHQRDGESLLIAEPSDFAVQDIERIAGLLMEPLKLINCCIRPVITASPEDSIEDAFAKIAKLSTTKLPVYDGAHFVSLLTVEDISYWYMSGKTASRKVKDVIDSIPEKNHVRFLAGNLSAEDAIDVFRDAISSGEKLQAVLVTENGSEEEAPLGILTLSDVPIVLNRII
jgi:CBS domain-containing protein